MENQKTSPELSDSHYLRDTIEASTARKEYSEWISASAKELIEKHASLGPIRVGYDRDFGKFYRTPFYENWNIGVYLLDVDFFHRNEGVRLNLTEHDAEGEVVSVINLAHISLPRKTVTDVNGNELSIEELGNVHTTLEQLLQHAEQK